MPQEIINIGTAANDKTGDSLRSAFEKTNNNFSELYPLASGADNVVVVNSIDDFPSESGGAITLEDNKVYQLGADVTSPYPFVAGQNNIITSGNPFATILTYVGAGTMFTGNGVSFALDRIIIACPSAQAFNFTGTGNNETFGLNIVSIGICQKCGTFDDLRSVNITNSSFFNCSDGLTISGTTYWDTLTIIRMRLINQNGPAVGLDLTTSVHKTFEISDYVYQSVSGSVGISGLANSGNVATGFIANVVRGEFPSPITPLSGIASNDVRWNFIGNAGIEDSQNRGDLFLENGSETVTVVAASTFYEIGTPSGGANWNGDVQDRFIFNSAGYLTYIGEQTIDVQVIATATVEKVGGGSDVIEMRIANNWTAGNSGLAKSKSQTQNAQPTSITSVALTTVSEGDTIRPIFANNGSTSDIIVEVTSMVALG